MLEFSIVLKQNNRTKARATRS